MKKHIITIIIILTVVANIKAQTAKFDSLVSQGIRHIYNVEFEEAENSFRRVIADFPDHPAGKFFLTMIDWWRIMLDLDNESYDDMFFEKLEDVIFQCDQILEREPNNIDAWFFKGGAIGFRGRLRATRESWIKAADDGRIALPIVEKAGSLDPNNIDVQLGYGIYNYYAQVIPDKYPFVKPLMIFFPKGNKIKGIQELTNVAHNGKFAKYESRYFLMTLFYQFENNSHEAEKYANMLYSEFPKNPIFHRYLGRLSLRQGRLTDAYNIFTQVLERCDEDYFGYGKSARREANYYLGYYYFHAARDVEKAEERFKLSESLSKEIDRKEESGFYINSLLYLGNIYDLKGDRSRALNYYKSVESLRDYSGSKSKAKKYIAAPFSG